MRGSFRAGLAGLLVALLAAGCAHSNHNRGSSARGELDSGLAATPRGMLAPDVRAVSAFAEVDAALSRPDASAMSYHALSPDQCQCLAASASSLANLFDSQRCVVQSSADVCRRGLDDGECVQMDVLHTAALEARNRSSADALEQYYTLAESEARRDLVDDGLRNVDGLLADLGRMREQGLTIPLDETQFQRERIALVDQRVQLDAGIERLNMQLWRALGMDRPGPAARIWPATELSVDVRPVDVEDAVQDALALRPELTMLRRLRSTLDTGSLAGARQALSQVNALLGSQAEIPCVFSPLGLRTALVKRKIAKSELTQRRQQLAIYQRQREQQVADQVRDAAATVETRLRQIALAKETAERWDARVAELQDRSTTGGASFADVAAARLSRQKAQSDLTGQVAGWKIALVRLKEAQGLLVAECPHQP